MNVFLDMGAYDGMSAEFFRKYHPAGNDFMIFSFECDRRNIAKLRQRSDLNIRVIEKAVWINDGITKYYFGKDDGGSLYSSKKTGDIRPENNYEVETIDIGNFIKYSLQKSDYIIAKLNVEGAEYSIIPHLQKMNLISWIDVWFVQWHWQKLGMQKSDHDRVEAMIPAWYPWECQLSTIGFVNKFLRAL